MSAVNNNGDVELAGRLVIVSGPSGVGKSTVLAELIKTCSLPLVMSVSATTRSRRDGEQHGVHYHFLTEDEFAARRAAGDFLECCLVFGRHWYGTLKSEVDTGLQAGKWVILEIDVEGAGKVVQQHPDAVSLFLGLPTLAEVEQRLRERGTEDEETIQHRLHVAKTELEHARDYDYFVVNDVVSRAAAEICHLLKRTGDKHAGRIERR